MMLSKRKLNAAHQRRREKRTSAGVKAKLDHPNDSEAASYCQHFVVQREKRNSLYLYLAFCLGCAANSCVQGYLRKDFLAMDCLIF
jgi:hypothetical protein